MAFNDPHSQPQQPFVLDLRPNPILSSFTYPLTQHLSSSRRRHILPDSLFLTYAVSPPPFGRVPYIGVVFKAQSHRKLLGIVSDLLTKEFSLGQLTGPVGQQVGVIGQQINPVGQ